LKVSREIPLPWLIGIVAAGFLQAALVYYKQDAQAEQIAKLIKEVQTLSTALSGKDLKDLEHDSRSRISRRAWPMCSRVGGR